MSRRSIALGLIAGAAAVSLTGLGDIAVALTSTTTTLTSHHAGSRPKTLNVAGQVKPAPAQGGEHMVVKYYKKNADGSWTKVDTERPALSDASAQYGARFVTTLYNSPTTGKCKIVAKYPGDDTYAASKAVAKVACRTGQSL
jgi:hypothetical protein